MKNTEKDDTKAQLDIGGIVGEAKDSVDDILGQPTGDESGSQTFRKSLNVGDFDTFGTSLESGKWNRVAEFVVGAQERYKWGYGSASAPENQGYIYCDLVNSDSEQVEGTVRFAQTDANERQLRTSFEDDVQTLDGSKTDRKQQKPLPKQVDKPWVGRDSMLVIEINPTNTSSLTTEDVDSSNSEVILPVTVDAR